MELKILQKKEEPLLSRTRVEAEISFEKSTPSGKDVKSDLAKSIGKDEKLLDIRGIYTAYGLRKARVLCYAYDNEDTLKRVVIEKEKAEKKPGEKAQGAKKDEKSEAKPEQKAEKPEVKDKKEEKESKEQKPDEKEARQEKKEEGAKEMANKK